MTSLLFNTLSRLVRAFLPRRKHLLISWLQSPPTLILQPKKIKPVTVSLFSPSIYHEVMGLDPMNLVFWKLSFKPVFLLSSFTFIERLFNFFSLFAIITKRWIQPKCPSTDDIEAVVCVYAHDVIFNSHKTGEILSFVTKWMDLQCIMLSELVKERNTNSIYCYLYEEFKKWIQRKESDSQMQRRN